ncbi:MAG TPA: alpha-L-arabinofuranosidase C-terminal domain-containing protein [Bryobacteraceae bacterium]|nr:alpha-L-arabinofuranosidase C-terminal domain-containing protein [Bryobacteraceae bacterium]
MYKTRGVILVAMLFCARAGAQDRATLTIHADKRVAPASPALYGLMTEEINYSYDGGLYAEMVNNRLFRNDWSGVLHWYLVEKGSAKAKMSIDREAGPSAALKTSLRLETTQTDEQNPAGVLNEGYWGMELRPNTTYKGSFYAKTDSASPSAVMVRLVDNDSGKAVATATVSDVAQTWAQHAFTLKTAAAANSTHNHLELLVSRPGTLWLQLVSLFPPTYKDSLNGNRIDLMEKLAAMHPAFLRFPGGNYLEGDHIADRFQWKKTVGPLVDRAGHQGPWRYYSSDGLGLLEFLEWCEDLNMQPLLAVYAGYSLAQEHVNPGMDLEPYVNDALDEIEYVTGGTDTKWGAVRAANGHPKPFSLKYVEIGNEDQFDRSRSYDGRFAQFYKAIKAKYPDLQLIATAPVKSVRPDVIDDHFYRRATEFFSDTGHYDKADRKGPKIFVGEWATREGAPTPNMGAALGDAAWMTGMERNSDIVIMASYAPLLVNVNPNGSQWESDLIGYDASRSYGSPSYYAQVMFASYVGDAIPETKLEGAGDRLFYSVTRNTAAKQLYVKLVNASSSPAAVDLAVDGGGVAPAAKIVSLSAPDTQTTNTINQPDRIAPVESTIHVAGSLMHHVMPPYTIQVMRLDLR